MISVKLQTFLTHTKITERSNMMYWYRPIELELRKDRVETWIEKSVSIAHANGTPCIREKIRLVNVPPLMTAKVIRKASGEWMVFHRFQPPAISPMLLSLSHDGIQQPSSSHTIYQYVFVFLIYIYIYSSCPVQMEEYRPLSRIFPRTATLYILHPLPIPFPLRSRFATRRRSTRNAVDFSE